MIFFAHGFGHVHDALNINDRFGLQFVDPGDHLTEFLIIIHGIRNTKLIHSDRDINLPEFCL